MIGTDRLGSTRCVQLYDTCDRTDARLTHTRRFSAMHAPHPHAGAGVNCSWCIAVGSILLFVFRLSQSMFHFPSECPYLLSRLTNCGRLFTMASKRKCVSVEEKIKVPRHAEKKPGLSQAAIARHFGMAQPTVSSI